MYFQHLTSIQISNVLVRLAKSARRFFRANYTFHNVFHRRWENESARKTALEGPQVSKNRGFAQLYFTVTALHFEVRGSDGSRTSQQPDGEHEHGAEEPENSINCDSYQAKRQREQPHDGVQHESKQCDWPAQEEQDDPQEKSSHGNLASVGKGAVTGNDAAPRRLLFYITRLRAERFPLPHTR
jgi:hypothetical protein